MRVIKLTAILTLMLLTMNMFTLARPIVLPARKVITQTLPMKTLLSERYAAFEDENPAVKTVRSVKEYRQLRKLHSALPAPSTINFTKYAVVAFYIVLPTPCHRVDFSQSGTNLDIVLKGPDPVMMCADVLAPTVIVKQLPVKQQQKLKVKIVRKDRP